MSHPGSRHLFTLLASATLCLTRAATLDLIGPDGAVQFRLDTDPAGHLRYTVALRGQTKLEAAPAGVIIDDVDLGAAATPGTPRTADRLEVFPWRGPKTQATNLCRVADIPVRTGNLDWTLEVRVFNDGAAFRYRVPGTGPRRVLGESTRWQLPANATVWFQTDTRNYEGVYQSAPADRVPLELEAEGKKHPTHLGLPMTVVYPDRTYAMVTEASLYRYSGLTLRPSGNGTFLAAFEDDPGGWRHAGEVLSPWRVVLLTPDLNGLVNSDLIAALGEPPDPALFPNALDAPWIRPGKAPCTWMVFGNDGAQWDRQKWWVDRCAAMNCEYLLVDAGWRTERWGWLKNGGDLWQRTAELCRYAAERHVGIVLWHSYPEGRDDGPGLTTVEAREELFRRCQQAGVKGVKIDFFDSESRTVIDAYEDLLRRSARYQLMVNFHGANKPTGEPRTWPHEITREGIREQEYVLWDSLPLPHYGALPFTRMAAGHADFLPGYVQPRFLKNTTAVFQMASVVVFSSPFLCWPDNPDAYLDSPFLPFARAVPVTWDETRVLPGSAIGDLVMMARRKGTEWYLAILNCRAEPRSVDLDLAPLTLTDRVLTAYRDAAEGHGCQVEAGRRIAKDLKLTVPLRPGGGFLAHVHPPKDYAGWK